MALQFSSFNATQSRRNFAYYLVYLESYNDLFFYLAFLITQPNDKLSMEDQLPKDIALILKSQSKIKTLKATRSSSLDSK